ncbi:MAG: GxxExxY protein [Terriglobales bacterium]
MQENDRLDQISRRIIGAAIEVHRHLGPGLLESAYQSCLAFELNQLGLKVEEQKPLTVVYKQVKLDCGYRLDMVVEDEVILEVKAIEKLLPIHEHNSYRTAAVEEESGLPDELPRSSFKERVEKNRE